MIFKNLYIEPKCKQRIIYATARDGRAFSRCRHCSGRTGVQSTDKPRKGSKLSWVEGRSDSHTGRSATLTQNPPKGGGLTWPSASSLTDRTGTLEGTGRGRPSVDGPPPSVDALTPSTSPRGVGGSEPEQTRLPAGAARERPEPRLRRWVSSRWKGK